MGWFLCDTDLRHERVRENKEFPELSLWSKILQLKEYVLTLLIVLFIWIVETKLEQYTVDANNSGCKSGFISFIKR